MQIIQTLILVEKIDMEQTTFTLNFNPYYLKTLKAGIDCPAHILHDIASTSADVLSVDMESIVLKM